jgi:hypothetical protein
MTYGLVPLVAVSVIGVIIEEFDAGLAGQMTLATDLKSIYPDVASLLLSIAFYLQRERRLRSVRSNADASILTIKNRYWGPDQDHEHHGYTETRERRRSQREQKLIYGAHTW